MKNSYLLAGTAAMALACAAYPAVAATTLPTIVSGGDASGIAIMNAEFTIFNTAQSNAGTVSIFGTGYASPLNLYYAQDDDSGLQAVIYDNMQCLVNGGFGNDKQCNNSLGTNPNTSAGGTNTTDFVFSNELLSPDQWAIWYGSYTGSSSITSTHGQSTAGNIIQIPAFGTPITIVIKNAAVTANNQVSLSDDDICGIFSGSITNWAQTSAYIKNPSSLTPGQITVVYRADETGDTAIFSAHLSQVCNSGNSAFPNTSYDGMNNLAVWNPGANIFGATNFISLFMNGTADAPMPPGALPEDGSDEVASTLQNQTSAIGYLTPDFTTISAAGSSTGVNNYGLVVANVNNIEPTFDEVNMALMHPGAGAVNTSLPTATTATQQGAWVPVIPVVTGGYPIVGYSTFVFPQCFSTAHKAVATGIADFLDAYYGDAEKGQYLAALQADDFVPLSYTRKTEEEAIQANIMKSSAWNFSIDNKTACSSLAGR